MANRLQTATSLLNSGRPKKAYQEAKAAIKEAPGSPNPYNIAGLALSALGRHSDAAKSFFKATQIAPDFDNARRNLAQALILDGRTEKARQVLSALLKKNSRDEAGWYLLGQCELVSGHLREAEDATSQAIAIAQDIGRNRSQRAAIREKRGNLTGAIEDYQVVLQKNPRSVETLVNISVPLARQLRSEEALEAVMQAVKLAPDHIGAKQRLGMHFVEAGKPDDAIQVFQDILRLETTDYLAMEQLSQLQTEEQNNLLKPQVFKGLKQAPRRSVERASLHFALAHIYRKEGDRDGEVSALKSANADMSATLPYDHLADEERSQRILNRFPDVIEVNRTQPSEPRPIYILGLPRSGTTLAESILGPHPGVLPLGERAAVGMLLHDIIEREVPFDDDAQTTFRKDDAALRPPLSPDHMAYVDKMPENYRFIGFLKQAYPNCKIINMVRDPKDIALSMWRGRFSGTALNYTYAQRAMSARFNIYARMMRHRHSVLDGEIMDLRYEDLVRDLPQFSKQLADFCEIEWTEGMATPHKTSEQIMTLSATQIRQPVHSRSIGASRGYEAALSEFSAGLDPNLWPEL